MIKSLKEKVAFGIAAVGGACVIASVGLTVAGVVESFKKDNSDPSTEQVEILKETDSKFTLVAGAYVAVGAGLVCEVVAGAIYAVPYLMKKEEEDGDYRNLDTGDGVSKGQLNDQIDEMIR